MEDTEQTYVDGVVPPTVLEDSQPQVDYFGFSRTGRYTFPDGKTFLDLKAMNEGAKKEFQRTTQSDVVMERNSGNARMKADMATLRHEKIRQSVTGWNLVRQGALLPFTPHNLAEFLKVADPSLIEEIEKAINKLNPWMLAEMSVADIDKEIENLQEMRKVAEERELGEAASSDRQSSS